MLGALLHLRLSLLFQLLILKNTPFSLTSLISKSSFIWDHIYLSGNWVIFQAKHNLSAPPLNLTGCLMRWLRQSFSPAPWEIMKANYNWSCHFAAPLSCSHSPAFSFLSIYHSIGLSHPVFHSLYKPEIDQNVQPSMYNPQHWPEFPFFSLCFLCSTVPLSLPPHPLIPPPPSSLSLFSRSLQLSFSSKWTQHIRWFCYFFPDCFVCNHHIHSSSPVYQDLTLWKHLYAGWVFPRLPQRH